MLRLGYIKIFFIDIRILILDECLEIIIDGFKF